MISREAQSLIDEIRNKRPTPVQCAKTVRVKPLQVEMENRKRNRIPSIRPVMHDEGRPSGSMDDPSAVVAPSVRVNPLPYTIEDIPTFDEVLTELGVPELVYRKDQPPPHYMVDCRIITDKLLRRLITARAEIMLKKMESKKVDRGTQTFVSVVAKQRIAGCVNCRSREHHFIDCKLPARPGFCHVCGADGFETVDCIYPHGIEHESTLDRCTGCANEASIYCPECPDCNIRFAGYVDWLRLNYATMPTWAIPLDHRFMINESEMQELRRRVKANFTNPSDPANRVRKFLIRENALNIGERPANQMEPSSRQLSVEKRKLAVQALKTPFANRSLDEVMKLRPELSDGQEIKIIVPTKYKKATN